MEGTNKKLSAALWQIYRRAERPSSWQIHSGNLPCDDLEFSERILRQHLDESHHVAARKTEARLNTISWLWGKLELEKVALCDQSYAQEEVVAMLKDARFTAVSVYPAWDDLPFYDGDEWIAYIATK